MGTDLQGALTGGPVVVHNCASSHQDCLQTILSLESHLGNGGAAVERNTTQLLFREGSRGEGSEKAGKEKETRPDWTADLPGSHAGLAREALTIDCTSYKHPLLPSLAGTAGQETAPQISASKPRNLRVLPYLEKGSSQTVLRILRRRIYPGLSWWVLNPMPSVLIRDRPRASFTAPRTKSWEALQEVTSSD